MALPLKKLPHNIKEQIHSKILELKNYQNLVNVIKLTNQEPAYRLRVGNYRVLFDVFESNIEIGRILNSKESYK